MAAMSDLATPAAAVSAGYQKIQLDRGANSPYVKQGGNRFVTQLEKWLTGEPGKAGHMLRAYGEDASSFANSDNAALAALNAKRRIRYGTGTNQNAGALPGNAGWQHVVDVT
jgi:hypothetical protein